MFKFLTLKTLGQAIGTIAVGTVLEPYAKPLLEYYGEKSKVVIRNIKKLSEEEPVEQVKEIVLDKNGQKSDSSWYDYLFLGTTDYKQKCVESAINNINKGNASSFDYFWYYHDRFWNSCYSNAIINQKETVIAYAKNPQEVVEVVDNTAKPILGIFEQFNLKIVEEFTLFYNETLLFLIELILNKYVFIFIFMVLTLISIRFILWYVGNIVKIIKSINSIFSK
jgi:hypothetical protein